ncbi:GntR family transcriptional regulator [Ethanoligenens sp.]|uniref:GntR family transcriptional regulator n=1 Tax=Ethanoligenens sp. TaxID=2099655 RepID=UPI0039E7C8A0
MKPSFNSTFPIYLQIMEQIKQQIVSGVRKPGSKVESVRELAQQMEVNPNTMQRAFAELERGGLLHTERTAGRFITDDITRINAVREESAQKVISNFMDAMQHLGFSQIDIMQLVKKYTGEG